jgi:diguanylate cyclase (GGDEF)-like protein
MFSGIDYLAPPLLVAVVCIGMVILAALRPNRAPGRTVFLLLLSTTAGWGLSILMMRASPTTDVALKWDYLVCLMIFATHAFHYHFSLKLAGAQRRSLLLWGLYAIVPLSVLLMPTGLVIKEVTIESYGYAPVFGPVGYALLSMVLVAVIGTSWNLYKAFGASTDGEERNRLIYVFVGSLIVGIGTLLEMTPIVFPTAIYSNLIFCAITTVAMVRYHLLDIHIIIRKTLSYALLSAVVVGAYLVVLTPIYLLITHAATLPLAVNLLFLLGLTIVFQPLLRLAQGWVDRMFYRDRYDYLRALERFGEETRYSLDLGATTESLITSITSAMRCGKAVIFLTDVSSDELRVAASVGLEHLSSVRLAANSKLVDWLSQMENPVTHREIDLHLQQHSISDEDAQLLDELETELVIPLKTAAGLQGILFLSQKLSEQGYSLEELRVLRVVTSQMSAILDNTRLYVYDKLTGLYNRAYLELELARLAEPSSLPLSVIMGDLNGLKLANDALGHEEGDRLLAAVAAAIRRSCRSEDIIARWGGDEFIVLLPKTPEREAMDIASVIRSECRSIAGFAIQPSIALGVSSINTEGMEITNMLREAEDRMYRNKLMERNSSRHSIMSSLEQSLWETTHETEEHARRMQTLALPLARALALSDNELDELALLATLHDIGKIAIPKDILTSPNRLSQKEWEIIQKHPEIGYRIAMSCQDLVSIAEGILTHHEKWDGTGYPLRLQGNAIPLGSRIISIIDAYDVITSGRPYKKPASHEDAIEELRRCSGTQFDPTLVELFATIMTVQDSVPAGRVEAVA